jgi:chorismate mutase
VPTVLRGIRGATRPEADTPEAIEQAVAELAAEVLRVNGLDLECVISVVLTSTPDLRSAFPARAMRRMGWEDVPLLCAQEIDVEGAMSGVVRILIHVDADRRRDEIVHVYLRGTESLRS